MPTVGELSTTRPLAVKVFQRHGIDFCCGGGVSLAEACVARGLDEAALLAEIAAEEARAAVAPVRWDQQSTADLVDHLVRQMHRPLAEDLPRVHAMAQRVLMVHGHKDGRLQELADVVAALCVELEAHFATEERVLLPWIVQRDPRAAMPMDLLVTEHSALGDTLTKIRELTDQFQAPRGACATWRALWQGLAAVDAELTEHIAISNNVLFPRARMALGG